MQAAIFGDDIEMYDEAIQRNGEYELSNITVKPVPAQFRSSTGDYQMSFNERMKIIPLDLSRCSVEPQYRALSLVPHTFSNGDELIDVVAVVLFVSDIRPVQRGNDTEQHVRDIFLVDDSVQRPMKLSAWNRFAMSDADFITSWSEGFVAIGFTGIRPVTVKGLSLATTLSTTIVCAPIGPRADTVRMWSIENTELLEEWRAKCVFLNTMQAEKTVVPITVVAKKKAASLWQEEKFWIQASLPFVFARDIYCYSGCGSCGHRVTDEIGSKFCCPHCNAEDTQAIARATMNANVVDASGSLKITAFSPEIELILGLKIDQIIALKNSENGNALDEKLDTIKNREMIFQIAPTSALSTSNVLKWIVRVVEPVPEQESPFVATSAAATLHQCEPSYPPSNNQCEDIDPEVSFPDPKSEEKATPSNLSTSEIHVADPIRSGEEA